MVTVPPRNNTSDLLLLVQEDSQKNCMFQLDLSGVGTLLPRLLVGGANYWWDSSPWADARADSVFSGSVTNLSPNTIELYEGGSTTGLSGNVGALNDLGGVTNVYFPHNVSTFTGQFGEIMTLYQTYPFDISTQPTAGAQPAAGWPSYVYRRNATYTQGVYLKILTAGSGYAVGDSISVTGGSGTGMIVWVVGVDSSNAVTHVKLSDMGQNYLMDDIVTLGGGGCTLVLRFPPSKELVVTVMDSTTSGLPNVQPLLLWEPIILTGGTGYAVGTETATCDAPVASDLEVNILVVSGGIVQDLEIVIPNATTIISNNQLDYVYTVSTGGSGCTFRLGKPRKAEPVVMTGGGSGYSTAVGVSTLNMTANNLNLIADFSVLGQCLAIDYAAADQMPLTNDLSRYTVGDVLAYNQDGNVTATAEILTLDPDTQSITFNQLTNGVGYVQPVGNYGFVPTLNTSDTATTVDVTASGGIITGVSINTLGSNVQFGDILLIEAGDNNAVVRLESERDVPPQWQERENNRAATAQEWNDYATVMKGAVNLLDQDLVVNMRKGHPWYYNQSYYNYGDPDNKDPNEAGWTQNSGPI